MSEAEDASGKGSNLTAVEAISARLAEVTRLAEKLDARLCEAGARTRPVPMSSSAMSSTSSLFSSSNTQITTTTTPLSTQIQSISTGISASIPATTSSIAITAPLISSSVSTVQLQPKCVSTILSSATMTSGESAGIWKESTMSGSVTTSGTACTSIAGDKAGSAAVESGKVKEKIVEKETRETEAKAKQDISLDGVAMDDEKAKEEVAEDVIEKSFDDSLADDSNIDGYVTATECSTTPTARSRSESFVTSPECEDLAAPATVTISDTWWNIEEPKFITANATLSSSVIKQAEASKEPKIEKKDTSMDVPKTEMSETNKEKQTDKFLAMEKRVEEKSGKIVKEVTETTTLRVSHDTRLDIASYKVISNTVQDHRENVDVKEIMDLERIVSPDVHEKTNGYHETDSGPKSETYSRRDELSTKTDDIERVIKFAKVCEITQESRTIPVDISKDMTLSLKEYTRHHEDSGIEMSPTKKDENLEGQDFLERARKVSSIESSSMNGDRQNGCCCSCNFSHEACSFDPFSMQQNLLELTSVNQNRRRVQSVSNAS